MGLFWVFFFLFLVVGVVGFFFGGLVYDRMGRRSVLLIFVFNVLLMFFFVVMVFFWIIIFFGFMFYFVGLVVIVYIFEKVSLENLGLVMGFVNMVGFFGVMVGFYFVGLFIDIFGYRFVFLFIFVMYLFVWVILWVEGFVERKKFGISLKRM